MEELRELQKFQIEALQKENEALKERLKNATDLLNDLLNDLKQ